MKVVIKRRSIFHIIIIQLILNSKKYEIFRSFGWVDHTMSFRSTQIEIIQKKKSNSRTNFFFETIENNNSRRLKMLAVPDVLMHLRWSGRTYCYGSVVDPGIREDSETRTR